MADVVAAEAMVADAIAAEAMVADVIAAEAMVADAIAAEVMVAIHVNVGRDALSSQSLTYRGRDLGVICYINLCCTFALDRINMLKCTL